MYIRSTAFGVVADEAHLQHGLRVVYHDRRHHHEGYRFLGLVVELNPSDVASFCEILQSRY